MRRAVGCAPRDDAAPAIPIVAPDMHRWRGGGRESRPRQLRPPTACPERIESRTETGLSWVDEQTVQIHGPRVRFGVHSGQQYRRFADLVELWRLAEELGYDMASLFDHLRPPLGGPDGPCFEGT